MALRASRLSSIESIFYARLVTLSFILFAVEVVAFGFVIVRPTKFGGMFEAE